MTDERVFCPSGFPIHNKGSTLYHIILLSSKKKDDNSLGAALSYLNFLRKTLPLFDKGTQISYYHSIIGCDRKITGTVISLSLKSVDNILKSFYTNLSNFAKSSPDLRSDIGDFSPYEKGFLLSIVNDTDEETILKEYGEEISTIRILKKEYSFLRPYIKEKSEV